VWNLNAYAWMKGASPDTVNPSLWRHMDLLRKNGLFKVTDGVWQVRGFDVSNMTIIKGATGWVVIDPLTSRATGAAAIALANQQLGARPVTAVIYSHSHSDHFGGVRGVATLEDVKAGKTAIIAPAHFMEETASENIMAGGAMGRRAQYQFGGPLAPGPQGQMGSGIGTAIGWGSIDLIAPTLTITKTGEKHVIDGVELEFQMVPETEAPAEMNVYLPASRTLLTAEIATCSLHNILTPRGAKVRDALAWAGYLTEAVRLYGERSDAVISSHCWPRFGQPEVVNWLGLQRDNYKYLHDQTVRMMNNGLTQTEIAEAIAPPPGLAKQWFARGYYGTYSHNSKAVYQRYLGWYDAVPANLNPWPPAERGRHYVAALGGAANVLTLAKAAMAKGDYRWSSELLNHLVFADAKNAAARGMLADSYEQLGYQAEASTWRNMYLTAAKELREKVTPANTATSPDLISAIPTGLLFDTIATRIDPAKLGDRKLALNFVFAGRDERAKISTSNSVMITEMGEAHAAPQVTVTGPRQLFLGLFYVKAPIAQLEAAGLKIEGDRTVLEALQAAIEMPVQGFNIIEP
jgi:alkyl sulfatase BDS1-like metallo-beta-lactamase superfamily hydrolase